MSRRNADLIRGGAMLRRDRGGAGFVRKPVNRLGAKYNTLEVKGAEGKRRQEAVKFRHLT